MKEKTIYVVVTRTNTIPSRVIRVCTKALYNHVSLSFDSELEDLVSFGRLHPMFPFPGGFVHEGRHKGFFQRFQDTECLIYAKQVSGQEYERFEELLQPFENQRFKFNNLGCLTLLAGIPLERKNAYFCSQFCGKMLTKSGIYPFSKPFGLLRPADFCGLAGFSLLYKGSLQSFAGQPALAVG
ncbi:MAG: hypothetical protein PHE47_08310 [Oscillospiraceae bacterium]|nr:hypothetical protein [Oscillospiraceae bacterium]